MKPAESASWAADANAPRDWRDDLRVQAELMDGIEVAMCAFDEDDRAVVWNRTFLRVFPEHQGHVQVGESYADHLRRFYQARIDASSDLGSLEQFIATSLERHRTQTQPFEFVHHGERLQVASLPVPGAGRLRVWRSLAPLPALKGVAGAFASELGAELLEYVPEALVVCTGDGSMVWANASFCKLFGIHDRERVLGTTLDGLYLAIWQRAAQPESALAARDAGLQLLRVNTRVAGAPFELPLPGNGCCRVIARPARDGSVFFALIDISALKQSEAALQLTLDNAGRGIIRYDSGGRVQLFNRQALELLGLPHALLSQGAHIDEIVRFQRERGDFTSGADILDADACGAASFETLATDLFADGQYLRRTRHGRVLEISTKALADGGAVRAYTDVTEYMEAQRAVTEKTRALQITLDSMTQGISVIDGAGRLVFWNRRYQELLKLPESLLETEPTMEKVVRFQIERGDFGPNFEFVDAIARGYVSVGDKLAPLQGPETYVRKSADGRTFDVTTQPLPDGGVVRTFTDMTAYTRSQEDLARHQAQLGALVNTLPDRVWLKDERGIYLLSNPAHQRYHGRSEAEILGRSATELFGERGARAAVSDREAMQADTPLTSEEYDFGPDGNLRCAEVVKVAMRDDAGHCIGLLGIARDITARKQEEAALIKAKEQAQEASGAKSRFLSSMSHEIRTPMNAVLGMLTLLRGTSLTQRQEDYAGKAEGAARALLSLLNDILDFSKIEAGKMRLDTRSFSLEGLLSDLSVILSSNVGDKDLELLYDLDPRVPDGLVGDDMRLRQILINLGGNAVKFTERGEVVVRTRLVNLEPGHASIEFSVQDTGIGISPEQQARLFSDYVQATDATARQFGGTGLGLGICRRLTDLMGTTLNLASTRAVGSRFWFTLRLPLSGEQPAAPAPVPTPQRPRVLIVDDNPLARDTLAALARAARWHADTAQDGRQALERMLSSGAVGLAYDVVFIDWIMPGMDGWQTCARIRELPAGARTPLVIMVTGHGREMLDRRSAREQAMLDGFLVKPVTAGMLQGALRRALQRGGEDQPAAKLPYPQPLAGLRLLVAEDNPVNQQIATELLARQGAQVQVVDNGRLAVDRVLAGEPYDAVLMDVQMPVLDGLEATRELRRGGPAGALPIIAMTANAMDSDRQDCLAAGMNDHVAKPFSIEDVVATLLRHLRPQGQQAAPGDAPGARPLPVFDRAGALERLGGDESLLATILPVFCGNLESALRELAVADARSTEELSRLLHSIKGMAANLGADQLAALASEGEVLAREGAPEALSLARQVSEAIVLVLEEVAKPHPLDFW